MNDPIPRNPDYSVFLADFDLDTLKTAAKLPNNKNTEKLILDSKLLFEQTHPVLFAELERSATILLEQLGSIDAAGDIVLGGVVSYKFLNVLANEHGIKLPTESGIHDDSYPLNEAEIEIANGSKGVIGESLFSQYTMIPEFRTNHAGHYDIALDQTARRIGRRPVVVKAVVESMLPGEGDENPDFKFNDAGDRIYVNIDGANHEILLAEVDQALGFLIGYELVTRRLLQTEDKIKFMSEFDSSS